MALDFEKMTGVDCKCAFVMCKLVAMKQSPAIEAARNFIHVVWNGNKPSDAALSAALDGLFIAYHNTQPIKAISFDLDPPEQDWKSLNRKVAKRFPDYGFYSILDPLEVHNPTYMVGDAIDDIADITADMSDTVWLGEHLDLDCAHSKYTQFYFHWGRHARELSLYLHARQFR